VLISPGSVSFHEALQLGQKAPNCPGRSSLHEQPVYEPVGVSHIDLLPHGEPAALTFRGEFPLGLQAGESWGLGSESKTAILNSYGNRMGGGRQRFRGERSDLGGERSRRGTRRRNAGWLKNNNRGPAELKCRPSEGKGASLPGELYHYRIPGETVHSLDNFNILCCFGEFRC
jgi:hypothetical protein